MNSKKDLGKYASSDLWKKLGHELFSEIDDIQLNNFRAPGDINNRLASWDPIDSNTYRYYKTILFDLVVDEDDDFIGTYKKIGNTSIGNPVEVIVNGHSFNLDYIFSVQEIFFLKSILLKNQFIVEIGGGFGRTCHAILNNFPQFKKYTIIDIPEVLTLSKKYLNKVLSKEMLRKVIFLENTAADNAGGGLYINIDSMQEMDQIVVDNYLKLIDNKAHYFYTRNTIGKYDPSSIGLHEYNKDEYKNALKVGLCQNVIDIYNSDELEKTRVMYLEKYSPSSNWKLIKHEKSIPWQYYHHALYENE